MIPLLPYPDFEWSVKCMHNEQLAKLRPELINLLRVIRHQPGFDHPSVIMWRGRIQALQSFVNSAILEWQRRGFFSEVEACPTFKPWKLPSWFGNDQVHRTHRAYLLSVNEHYYRQLGWEEEPNPALFWPTKS